MIEIFEKETEKEVDGEMEKKIEVVEQKDATHKHTCYHDEADNLGQARPCRRVKL